MTTDSSSAQAVHSSPRKALSWVMYHSCRRRFPEQQQLGPPYRPLVPPLWAAEQTLQTCGTCTVVIYIRDGAPLSGVPCSTGVGVYPALHTIFSPNPHHVLTR